MNSSPDRNVFIPDVNLSAEDPLEFFPSEHQITPGLGRRALEAVLRGFAAFIAACRSVSRVAGLRLRLAAGRLSTWRVEALRLPRWRLPAWRAAAGRGRTSTPQPLRSTDSNGRFSELASTAFAAGALLSHRGQVSRVTVAAFTCGVVVGGSAVWLTGASPRGANRITSQQPLHIATQTAALPTAHAQQPLPDASESSGRPVSPAQQPVRITSQTIGSRVPAAQQPAGSGDKTAGALSIAPARVTSVAAAPAPRPVAPARTLPAANSLTTKSSVATNSAATASSANRSSAAGSSAAASSAAKSSPQPFRGALVVNSLPSGARVVLNGRAVGTTPLVLPDQPAGSRAIQITLEGYEPWSSAVQVVAYTQTRVRAELKPRRDPAKP